MRKSTFYAIIVFLAIACEPNKKENKILKSHRVETHLEKAKKLFKKNKVNLTEQDSVIIFDSRTCPNCMMINYESAIMDMDRESIKLVVFTKADSTYFSSTLKQATVSLISETVEKVNLRLPYIYYYTSEGLTSNALNQPSLN